MNKDIYAIQRDNEWTDGKLLGLVLEFIESGSSSLMKGLLTHLRFKAGQTSLPARWLFASWATCDLDNANTYVNVEWIIGGTPKVAKAKIPQAWTAAKELYLLLGKRLAEPEEYEAIHAKIYGPKKPWQQMDNPHLYPNAYLPRTRELIQHGYYTP